jgi:hypothetical protein
MPSKRLLGSRHTFPFKNRTLIKSGKSIFSHPPDNQTTPYRTGGVIGLSLALGISRLFESLLFSIGPYDPITFIGVTLLLVVVALAATLVPAQVAMNVEPVAALRYE